MGATKSKTKQRTGPKTKAKRLKQWESNERGLKLRPSTKPSKADLGRNTKNGRSNARGLKLRQSTQPTKDPKNLNPQSA